MAIPEGRKVYLITETPLGREEITPFEKVPFEERLGVILEKVGAGAKEISKRIGEILESRKEKVKEVV